MSIIIPFIFLAEARGGHTGLQQQKSRSGGASWPRPPLDFLPTIPPPPCRRARWPCPRCSPSTPFPPTPSRILPHPHRPIALAVRRVCPMLSALCPHRLAPRLSYVRPALSPHHGRRDCPRSKIVLDRPKSLHILSNNRSDEAGHTGPPKQKGPDGATNTDEAGRPLTPS